MKLYAGTSGYSYKEWKGAFYPDDLAADEMLSFYADKLPAVEINNTFYRMPKTSVVETWAGRVPAGFRFVLKASRRITHFKRLKEAHEELEFMLGQFAVLGERLGAVLFQLPPKLKKDVPRLASFLELLPDGTRAAFEFRDPSWLDEEVHERLRERGCALVGSDTDDAPDPPVVRTADWGYLRLRRAEYGPEQLAAWADRIREQDWSEAFVFFKHEDAGAGPRLAGSFLERFEPAGA